MVHENRDAVQLCRASVIPNPGYIQVGAAAAPTTHRSQGDATFGDGTNDVRWDSSANELRIVAVDILPSQFAMDEFLGKAYFKEKGVPVVIARIFNTIGPRQTGQYGMVVPRLVQQALRDEPITVYGDGTQRRSFTWVGDMVGAFMALVDHPQAFGEVFNVGHHKDISIHELAGMIKEMTRSDSEIVFVPYDQAYEEGFEDMQRRLPDISKIQRLIDYRPTLDLPEMIERIIKHERQQR